MENKRDEDERTIRVRTGLGIRDRDFDVNIGSTLQMTWFSGDWATARSEHLCVMIIQVWVLMVMS